jgi:hypothetical protein
MAINRSLMERQLRMGGGIMNIQPRQQYGLGSFVKKAVKGVTGAVKKIAKSDIGKAALLAAGGYYLGGGSLLGMQRAGMSGFSLGNLPGAGFFGKGSLNPLLRKVGGDYAQSSFGSLLTGGGIPGASAVSKFVGDNAGMIGATVLGGVLGSMTPQEQEEVSGGRNVEALRSKLTKTYTDLQYDPAKIPDLVANDLSEYTSGQGGYAEGGRIGYGDGTPYVEPDPAMMVDTTTFNPIPEDADRQQAAEIAKIMMATRGLPREEGEIEDTETMSTEDFMLNEYFKPKREELMENFGLSIEEANNLIREAAIKIRGNRAEGGRMGYAFGTPEQNAIQAAGIEGLPLNQNPAGVTELDLRETGGFIPPVGVKEKADDIPAMLANNEFVFTADAVRGMGEGNVNKGAQRMYDMMKKLEKGGRV